MNDDDPTTILALLRSQHRTLDERISILRDSGDLDQLELARLKKRKLMLKDEIEALNDRMVPDILA